MVKDADAPDQTTIDNGPSDRRMSLSMLADATGGFPLVGSNNFKTAFDRIVPRTAPTTSSDSHRRTTNATAFTAACACE